MSDFTQSFITSLMKGQDYKRRKRIEEEEEEDRGIEKEILQHRLKELKISDRIRARSAAAENYKLLEGMPEENFAWDGSSMKSAPSALGPGFGEMEVPKRQAPMVDIPGIEELGVPGMQVRPRTMEQELAELFAQQRTRALATPRAVSRYSDLVVPNADGSGVEVLHEGDDPPDTRRAYTTRGPDGVTKTEYLTPEEIAARGPAVRHPMPQRGGNGGSNQLAAEDREAVVTGIMSGNLPPELPNTTEGLRVKSELSRRGFNLTKANNDLRALRTYMGTLNSQQQQEMLQATDIAEQALTKLEQINSREGNPRMWVPGLKNTVEMQGAAKAAVEALAILKSGGAQPNNATLERAEKELSAGLLSGALGPKIARLKEALKYRVSAVRSSFITTDDTGMAPAPAGKPQSNNGAPDDNAIASALKAKGYAGTPEEIAKVKGNLDALAELGITQTAKK